jgi:predicted DNA-binding antitoxin AbrB/MazE fold protein
MLLTLTEGKMHKIEIEAVYEDGVLKLPHELPLRQGQKVTITIHPTGSPARRRRGVIQWKGSQEDLDHLILSPDNDPPTC